MPQQLGFGRAEIALTILLVCGGGLLLWSFLKPDNASDTSTVPVEFTPAPGQYGDEAIQAIRSDLQILQEGSAPPEVLAESLVRLSYAAQDHARPWAMKYQSHSSPAVQMAVVEALGGFPDSEALDVIAKALQTDDRGLRITALRSLGRLQSAYRAYQINEYLKQTKDPEEIRMSLLSLYKCSNNSDERQAAAQKLIESIGDAQDQSSQEILVDLLPRLERLDEAVRRCWTWVRTTKNSDLALRSLLYLQSYNSKQLRADFAAIPNHKSVAFQQALLNFARQNCSGSLSDLERVFKEKEHRRLIQINCR